MAGIDAELEEKAVNLINAQLTALQQGEITDLEMDQTKALLRTALKVRLILQEDRLKYLINTKSWMKISLQKQSLQAGNPLQKTMLKIWQLKLN